jgi:hypothetical protein
MSRSIEMFTEYKNKKTLTVTCKEKMSTNGSIHATSLTSLTGREVTKEVQRLFDASIANVRPARRRMARPGAKNQLYGIEIWTKGSDGRHLSVVLKVQHFCDELAQLNGLAIGQWYVTFEVVSKRASNSQRKMAKKLAASLAGYDKPEVKALARNDHVNSIHLPALVLAITDQMGLDSRAPSGPPPSDYIIPPPADQQTTKSTRTFAKKT